MESLLATLFAGAALGWVAIPHCYAMCGPLHVSVCAMHREKGLKALSFFNLGRVLGYTVSGLLFGAFGEFVNLGPSHYCCQLAGFPVRGAMLSLLFPGVTMLVIAFFSFRKKALISPRVGWLAYFLSGGSGRLMVGGTCTSLIPCGMLYAAFSMAVGTGSWYLGGVLMLAFVITQTFFMQLGVSLGRLINQTWGRRFDRAFPCICVLIGAVYILLFAVRLVPA